jgi:hypothetical protein
MSKDEGTTKTPRTPRMEGEEAEVRGSLLREHAEQEFASELEELGEG